MRRTDSPMSAGSLAEQHQDYLRVRQPSLTELSQHMHLSQYHLQRLFTRWAGVSPKCFLQYLTKEHAKRLLRQHSVQETALTVGLSGPSRLHDLMLNCESVTPGQYQLMGRDLQVDWGVHPTPFGMCLLACTSRGVCFLAFFDSEAEQQEAEQDMRAEWALAHLVRNQPATEAVAARIFGGVGASEQPLSVLLKGSPFQLKVWEALLRMRSGDVCTYSDVAAAIDRPSATRAVASAVARNKIGYLIPCHRVIRQTGDAHAYRWGRERKQALIGWECARSEGPLPPDQGVVPMRWHTCN
jgi:AraC family transcriptional regulator, regulatory protein of adaptative response / methylated-DNA-[protein]-cysteine methyltransferase